MYRSMVAITGVVLGRPMSL